MNGKVLIALLLVASFAVGQTPAPPKTPAEMVSAQQQALAKFSKLDGIWRGSGWMIDGPDETARKLTQTLRVGPFLDGAVRLIEIRGYAADGSVGFHAFNTLAFDAQKSEYGMLARAGGRSGNFSFTATDDGYVWNIGTAERGLRYTGTVKGDTWTEVGESLDPSHAPIKVSEWTVHRVASTMWPEAGAVTAR